MLSIVQRELKTAARHPRLHRWRLRIAAVEIIVAAVLVANSSPGAARGGFSFFWFLAVCAFVFCLFEGVRKTADAISEEKREGTLGLLFLTTLNGADIVLGKLAGAMVQSINGLLAFIPILAITLLLGGTMLGELFRVALVLLNTLWASLTICLMVSAFSREKSLAWSTAVMVPLALVPVAAGRALDLTPLNYWAEYVYPISPAWLLFGASDAVYAREKMSFSGGMAAVHLLGWLALGVASYVTPRTWQDKFKKPIQARPRNNSPGAVRKRAARLDLNPIFWLAYSERQHRQFLLIFYAVFTFAAAAGIGAHWSFGAIAAFPILAGGITVQVILLYLFVASQASSNLAESKRNGASELLLTTPLKVENILSGQWLALRKMFLPSIIVVAASIIGLWVGFYLTEGDPVGLLLITKILAETVFGFVVVAWLGMWMGLSSKTPNRAFFKTILFGLIAPHLLICVPTIVIQVILLFAAKEKVKWNFRRFIAEKYLQKPTFILSPIAPPPLAK